MTTAIHSLTVSKITKLTADAIEVSFVIPQELQANFQFQAGQFVSLSAGINGENIERYYSICSAPSEQELSVGIKKVTDGTFSPWANEKLAEGDTLQVSEPQGSFVSALQSPAQKQFLLIAAGSGITPILSIIKHLLNTATGSQIQLIYANRDAQNTMFLSELQSLQASKPEQFALSLVYSRADAGDYQGRISPELITEVIPDLSVIDEFFVCGPEEMATMTHGFMQSKGLASQYCHIELFTKTELGAACDTTTNASVQIKIDGDTFNIDYADPTRSILDVALEYDGDLPYGCQNGSCGVCQAKIVSGEVEMEVNYALSQSEVDEGYVLMCQARPLTDAIEVDYDA